MDVYRGGDLRKMKTAPFGRSGRSGRSSLGGWVAGNSPSRAQSFDGIELRSCRLGSKNSRPDDISVVTRNRFENN